MGDIIIKDKVYKEAKIRKFIVDGKEQTDMLLTPDQLFGKNRIEISVEADKNTNPDDEQGKAGS